MRNNKFLNTSYLKRWLEQRKFNSVQFSHSVVGGSVVKDLPANTGDLGLTLIWEDPIGRVANLPMRHDY